MPAAHLSNVSHRYAGRWVLVRLNLRLPRGTRVLLTGGNGAGKTTLLRLLATTLQPTHGEVRLFGERVGNNAPALRRRLALMTHQHHFYDALDGLSNLRLVALLSGLTAPAAQAEAEALLARVGLRRAAHQPVAAYSAGMVRRLTLARVLLLRPELALLDEPFGQLDVDGVALVEEVLRELAEQNVTVVMSTHDAERARPLCNAHVHLAGGAIATADGLPAQESA